MGSESELLSHGEVDSRLHTEHVHPHQQILPKNHGGGCGGGGVAPLGRQSSIYSLTLDEFQHTLCDGGKNFGSMNMDEFLNSIWTAEENQQEAAATTHSAAAPLHPSSAATELSLSHPSATTADANRPTLLKQPSLNRQNSLTLPAPLCRKTVDEVWSEIHNQHEAPPPPQQHHHQSSSTNSGGVKNSGSAPRQPTFGEMTLEDFLIRAGVVREQSSTADAAPLVQQYGGMCQNKNNCPPSVGPAFANRSVLGFGGPPAVGASVGDPCGNGKGAVGFPPPVCFGGRVCNGGAGSGATAGGGGGGFVAAATGTLGMASPVNPVSSDGMCGNSNAQVDGNQYGGMEMGGGGGVSGGGGRRRIVDGPVEKVVERRQRRMIKNRESAARSRARKQAYTVELEAELNQLREENSHLKQALAEIERKRKQQYLEEMKKAQTKEQKPREKLRKLRRNSSSSL